MFKIENKDLRVVYEILKTLKKGETSYKENLKNSLYEIEKADFRDKYEEAFKTAQNDGIITKTKILGDFFFVPVGKGYVLPLQERAIYKIEDSVKVFENFGKEAYESMGNYTFENLSTLVKKFKISSKISKQEQFEELKKYIPENLKPLVYTKNTYSLRAERVKISNEEMIRVLNKYDILKEKYEEFEKKQDFLSFVETREIFENFYNTHKLKIVPDGQYFKNICSVKLIGPDLEPEIIKKFGLEDFFTFKESSKNIKNFIKKLQEKGMSVSIEELGFKKENNYAFYGVLKNEEELKMFVRLLSEMDFNSPKVNFETIKLFNKEISTKVNNAKIKL